MTQMNETQEPWDVEGARRAASIAFDQEIEAAITHAKETLEAARRDCDVCLFDRHCAFHCAEDCEHRAPVDPAWCEHGFDVRYCPNGTC